MSNTPIAPCDTPDPWLLPNPLNASQFFLTFTLGNRIELWSSSQLESFHNAQKTTVWAPAPNSPWSADIWAPEIHYLHGQWYIYAASAPPNVGNHGHRTIVLSCAGQDPMHDTWTFHGPMRGLPDHWHIDATVFEDNALYMCYSGWPLGDDSDTQQDLFLVRLISPMEADRNSLTVINRADQAWERPDGGRRGVAEGPTWVSMQGWRGIVYSAHGSWTCEYKLALLRCVAPPGSDLCDGRAWQKRNAPLLVSDRAMGGPFGPGHASFVRSPYGNGVFCVYHGTEREDEGWANRKGRVLIMEESAFGDGVRPLCCASSAWAGNGHQGVQAQNASQVPQQQQGHGFEKYQKYVGQVEKHIPVQYKGYFDKAKKFLNK